MSVRKLPQSFPFIPAHSTWEDWNGNFIMWYGQEPIPYVNEDNWKEAANSIVQMAMFAPYPLPLPDRFDNWQDWALEVTEMINGQTS